jgi:hypothetical protein
MSLGRDPVNDGSNWFLLESQRVSPSSGSATRLVIIDTGDFRNAVRPRPCASRVRMEPSATGVYPIALGFQAWLSAGRPPLRRFRQLYFIWAQMGNPLSGLEAARGVAQAIDQVSCSVVKRLRSTLAFESSCNSRCRTGGQSASDDAGWIAFVSRSWGLTPKDHPNEFVVPARLRVTNGRSRKWARA